MATLKKPESKPIQIAMEIPSCSFSETTINAEKAEPGKTYTTELAFDPKIGMSTRNTTIVLSFSSDALETWITHCITRTDDTYKIAYRTMYGESYNNLVITVTIFKRSSDDKVIRRP